MKYLDLFSGYGGFSLGIQQAYEDKNNIGYATQEQSETESILQDRDKPLSVSGDGLGWRSNPICIGFSEIDKYAIQIYEKHFSNQQSTEIEQDGERGNRTLNQEESDVLPTSGTTTLDNEIKGHKNYGDIKTINPAELPDFDLLCGGFPCQAFSIAGKRAGFEDARGTLIYDVFRIIKEKHPKLVLLENVKGLISHDNGRTFKTIITSLAELGYAVEWQVLNAKNFGVPQNRERVFIIGHLGGFGGRQIFPITESIGKGIEELTTGASQGYRVYSPTGINTTLASQAGGVGAKTGLVAPTIRATEYKHGDNQTTIAEDGLKIRRLTPTECERLMGLPDGWTEGVSDSQRYKLCGNGVVVNVVEAIIKRLI